MQQDVAAWCHRAQGTETFLIQLPGKMFLAIGMEGIDRKEINVHAATQQPRGVFPRLLGGTGDYQETGHRAALLGSQHDPAQLQIADVFRTLPGGSNHDGGSPLA